MTAQQAMGVNVYLLWHSRPLENGIDEHDTDDKLLGVFSTEATAEAAKREALLQPGFRDWPDAFCISRYEVDKREWPEGFV